MIEILGAIRRHIEASNERRSAQRGRVLLAGKMVYGAGFTADCRIRDLSPTGAKVVLPPHQATPDAFYLIVVRDGVAHHSRTQWISEGEAGVAFEDTHDFAGPTPPSLEPVRRLWAELAPRP